MFLCKDFTDLVGHKIIGSKYISDCDAVHMALSCEILVTDVKGILFFDLTRDCDLYNEPMMDRDIANYDRIKILQDSNTRTFLCSIGIDCHEQDAFLKTLMSKSKQDIRLLEELREMALNVSTQIDLLLWQDEDYIYDDASNNEEHSKAETILSNSNDSENYDGV